MSAEKTQSNFMPEVVRTSKSALKSAQTGPEAKYRDDYLLEEQLRLHTEHDNNVKSVSKELFNGDKIDVKTELSHDDINNVTKLRFLERRFNVGNVDVLIDSLLKLRVSKDRKSRQEFIQALRNEDTVNQEASFFKKLFGGTPK